MIASRQPDWLEAGGPESDLVVSSRVRLARNLAGVPFRGRATPEERERAARMVEEASSGLEQFRTGRWLHLDRLDPVARRRLAEARLVPADLAEQQPVTASRYGAVLGLGTGVSILVNEEDHVRIQTLRSGLDLGAAHRAAVLADVGLGGRLCFAFHPDFGYLTSCPTNVGTGLRASVLVHLPGLARAGELGRIVSGFGRVGLTCRGTEGEGSESRGDLHQLSNQVTLGRTEAELLALLGRFVREVLEHEREARRLLLRSPRARLEDRLWRALGTLRHARVLDEGELIVLIGDVRMGVGLGVLPPITFATMNRLLVLGREAHLADATGTCLGDETLAVHRATLVRRLLEEELGQ